MDRNRRLVIVMSVVLLVAVFLVTRFFSSDDKWGDKRDENAGVPLREGNLESSDGREFVIVLDAGHGGVDPVKVGVDGQLEKDINLSIVMKLKV